jgi:hypothetical protein
MMKDALVFALTASLAMPSVSVGAQEKTWSKIRTWKPLAEVTLRTSRSGPDRRYFIRADDDAITLLNVSNPTIPAGVARSLRRTIAEHPDYLPLPDGKSIAFDARASLDASGLFVAGQQIAEYDQVVERIPRAEVEGGAVSLEVNPGWSTSKQILVTLGAVFAAGASIVIIGCVVQGCS